ncbi:MAG: tetratricopeptide repeat protein [Clostridia bacterium]|nr:tetratricopeptide repeat protein [Clostridia bacterium]
MNILYVLIAGSVVFFAFQINLWLGIGVVALIIGFGIYHYIPAYYITKGNQAFEAGNEDAAREWYKKAYDTGRSNVKTKSSYAYILLRTGYADEAEKVLDPIIRVKGLDEQKRNLAKQQRCMVYYRQGRLDEAIAEAEELYENGYKTSNIYGMLGFFKQLRGDNINDILKICEEGYDYNKENRDILDNLAMCYYKLGRYEDAERVSDELWNVSETFIEGCYHGAQIACALGKYDKAADYIKKISECRRTKMTTISEEEIENLKRQIESHK